MCFCPRSPRPLQRDPCCTARRSGKRSGRWPGRSALWPAASTPTAGHDRTRPLGPSAGRSHCWTRPSSTASSQTGAGSGARWNRSQRSCIPVCTPLPRFDHQPMNSRLTLVTSASSPGDELKVLHVCAFVYIYIYIYAFSRRFYPKRLTSAFRLCMFCQYMCSLGIEPTTFCAANAML